MPSVLNEKSENCQKRKVSEVTEKNKRPKVCFMHELNKLLFKTSRDDIMDPEKMMKKVKEIIQENENNKKKTSKSELSTDLTKKEEENNKVTDTIKKLRIKLENLEEKNSRLLADLLEAQRLQNNLVGNLFDLNKLSILDSFLRV